MALYSTFFLCQVDQLAKGFPAWRPRLAEAIRRQIINPFTGEAVIVQTHEPTWPDDGGEQEEPPDFGVVEIKGKYEDYLESRLPAFVQRQPHWCAKGLMNIELDALGKTMKVGPGVQDALFSPPSSGGAHIWQIRSELLAALLALDDKGLKAAANDWAGAMSAPEHTQNSEGVTISDGWEPDDALQILRPLVKLARHSAAGQSMYLLLEP
jgi:hypothetical protein